MGRIDKTAGIIIALMIIAIGIFTAIQTPPDIQKIDSDVFQAVYLIPSDVEDEIIVHFIIQSGEADNHYTEGLAHYVEHLAWLNVFQSSGLDSDRHSNASTMVLSTSYFISTPRDKFQASLGYIGGVFAPITLDDAFMREERGIVQREYEYRVLGNPTHKIDQEISRLVYNGNRFSRSLIGTPQDITSFSIADAISLHKTTHTPANTVVVIYGNLRGINVEKVLAKVFPSVSDIERTAPQIPVDIYPNERVVLNRVANGIQQPELHYRKLVTLTEAMSIDVSKAQLSMLFEILDSSMQGGIAKPLRYDAFVAQSFSFNIWMLDKNHIELSFTAIPDQGISLDLLLQVFENAITTTAEGIPEDTFIRAKDRLLENLQGVSDTRKFAYHAVLNGISVEQEPNNHIETVALLNNVSQSDVEDLLKIISEPARVVISFIQPNLILE